MQRQYNQHQVPEPPGDSGAQNTDPHSESLERGCQVPSWSHSDVPQQHCLPSYSTQALKTFAPQQMAYTPDAAMVPIQSLQPVRSFVRVSGRTIRVSDVKAFPDKRDPSKQRWIQSFIIKDDHDTIEVKFWHKTQEHLNTYASISLDQVVHVWTDDVKFNTRPHSGTQIAYMPTTSSPFCLDLNEGRIGHRIELGSEVETTTLFRTALGVNFGGVVPTLSIKQVVGALSSIGNQRFNMVVCAKQVLSSSMINSRNGPLKKTLLTVFDVQGQEASLTLWGEVMAAHAEKWIPLSTALLLTGAQVSMYGLKLQITVGYQTHIQVDPECKNVEWLKHFAAQCSTLPKGTCPIVATTDTVALDQIRAFHRIADISAAAESLGVLEVVYGKTLATLTELNIESLASDVLTAKCESCKGTITSCKMEACARCQTIPASEDAWTFSLSRHISFMDNTAELHHPCIPSDVVETLLGFKPKEFSALSMLERTQLKQRHFLERFKIYYKISWSEFRKQQVVHILFMKSASLPELENLNRT